MVGLRLKMSVFLLTYQDDWAQTTKGGWGVFKPQIYYRGFLPYATFGTWKKPH